MKRWQTQREVLDSDDEFGELSLGSQSPGPGKPHKKAKNNHEATSRNHDSCGSLDTDIAGVASQASQMETDVQIEQSSATADFKSFDSAPLGLKYMSKTPQRESEPSSETSPPKEVLRTITRTLKAVLIRPYSSTPDEDKASDVQSGEVLADRLHDPEESNYMSDGSSSVLSERDVSPPPGFQFLNSSTQVPAMNHKPVRSDLTKQQGGKRNLRMRKDIQLHPYLLDKANYLKQCRQRGMRPVRLQESWNSVDDGKGTSVDNDINHEISSSQSSSQQLTGTRDGEPLLISHSHSYFENMSQTSDAETIPQRLPKRSRIADVPAPSPRSDIFAFPPSPPRTGSQLGTPSGVFFEQLPSPRFRLPRGMADVQLPTPEISSELKHISTDDESSSDYLPRTRPRILAAAKFRQDTTSIASSPESSSEEEEQDVEQTRLRREQKRIKGVLPASWLRLDFRKQQTHKDPQAITGNRQDNHSPIRDVPQKGIAQRIQRKHLSQENGLSFLDMSESEDGVHVSGVEHLKLTPRFRLPTLSRNQASPARTDIIDVDLMENDWIDPMFTGSTKHVANKDGKRNQQTKIADSWYKSNEFGAKRSGQRLAQPSRYHLTAANRKQHRKNKPKQTRTQNSNVLLSIVDAPRPISEDRAIPQFVRLALRHARRQPSLGRQPPTNKYVRLTTERDTEDALAVLQDWQAGKINRAISVNRNDMHREGLADMEYRSSDHRSPLAECTGNKTLQRHLPPPKPKSLLQQSSHSPLAFETPTQVRSYNDVRHANGIAHTGSTTLMAKDRKSKHKERHKRRKALFPLAARVRSAQVESLAVEFDGRSRSDAFRYRMQLLTRNIAKTGRENNDFHHRITRFLHDDREDTVPGEPLASNGQTQQSNEEVYDLDAAPASRIAHRTRKHRAFRLDAETLEYRQPTKNLPSLVDEDTCLNIVSADHQRDREAPMLCGLNLTGIDYVVDFDIRPLPLGVFFRQTSFIGSGDFHDTLNISSRDMNRPAGYARVHVGDQVMDWSSWTEDVASSLNRVIGAISTTLRTLSPFADDAVGQEQQRQANTNMKLMLRSIVRYISNNIWFADPVDRQSCCECIHRMVVDLAEVVSDFVVGDAGKVDILIMIRQYGLVIAQQVLQLCTHQSVDTSLQEKIRHLVLHNAKSLTSCIIPTRLKDIHLFHESMLRTAQRESGICDDELATNTIVIVHHVLKSRKLAMTFWQVVNASLSQGICQTCDVPAMDKLWYKVFTLLPTLEIDSRGIVNRHSQLGHNVEDWSLIRSLVARVTELYEHSSHTHGPTVNSYVRCVLARCHLLVNKWGWWRCETLLGTVYDFFARRGLTFLPNEESRGSPRFLEHLNENVSLDVEADDRAFHIFLKILATGLRGMRRNSIYDDRKIGGIAWRFIPSHGRTYRKDVELRTSDLDALRNHFDLLTTLYYASPSGHRPRVELLRNLVDHNASHREACRLNIRAWANTAAFQVSTMENSESLQPLLEWFQDMFKITVGQYRLARSEAEQDVEIAKEQGVFEIRDAVVEDTVARNQRHIAVTLVDALASLKRVMQATSRIDILTELTAATSFLTVFDLFDPSKRRLTSTIVEAINVTATALDRQDKIRPNVESQLSSDDSQDFGDSSALQELVAGERSDTTILQVLHDPISQFVSNVLGADEHADDMLIQSLIDVWIRLVRLNVSSGRASWIGYVDDYSAHSWNRLRVTMDKRKFTPYFMAHMIEVTGNDEEIKHTVFTYWISSLVERESILKYQHMLTSSLLNECPHDPLLRNLPFAKDNQHDLYRITLDDLRQRRLGLVSAVLSNMRESCETAGLRRSGTASALRMRYTALLKKLMHAMKTNYQDLQANWNINSADENVQGIYVEFVQRIVSFLQQHTTEICPIDRFFTDSTAFPLPATDPTYIIGRLRSYVPKLSEAKTRKQLAVFVQTVSERAAVDAQQTYLVNQLVAAMADDDVLEDGKTPTLRSVLLTSIFPAYFENVISKDCDWILALPMLEANRHTLGDLLYHLNIGDQDSVMSCVRILQVAVHAVNRQCSFLLSNYTTRGHPHIFRIMSVVFEIGKACLTVSSYIHRSTANGGEIIAGLGRLRSYCSPVLARLQSSPEEYFDVFVEANPPCRWPDTCAFATNQIRDALDNHWSFVDDRYWVRRGNMRKEIVLHLGQTGDELAGLIQTVSDFSRAYDTIFDKRKMKGRFSDETPIDFVVHTPL